MRGWNEVLVSSALVAAVAAGAAGCSGGGGGGGAAAPTGTVTVTLTDAPTDTLDSLVVTITEVSLIGGAGGEVAIPLPAGEAFQEDLLRLDGVSSLLTQAEVPAGTYTKVRLTVTDAVATFPDGTSQQVTIVANGKVELLCAEGIEVAAGEAVTIALDFDVEESIKLSETGTGELILRPELFVDCDGDGDVDGGTGTAAPAPNQAPPPADELPILEGLHGLVVEADPASGSFACMVGHHDEPHAHLAGPCSCQLFRLRVLCDSQTAIMDDQGAAQDRAAIQAGQVLELEGIMQRATPAGAQLLALEVVILRDPSRAIKVGGIVVGLDPAQGRLAIMSFPGTAPLPVHVGPDAPVHFLRERLSAAELALGQRVCVRGARPAAGDALEAGCIRIRPERFIGAPVAPPDVANRVVPVLTFARRFFHLQLAQVNVLCRPTDQDVAPLLVHLGPSVPAQVVAALRPGLPAGFFGRLVPRAPDATNPFPVEFLALGARPLEVRQVRLSVIVADPTARTLRGQCDASQDVFVARDGAAVASQLDCRFTPACEFDDGLTPADLGSASGEIVCEGYFEREGGAFRFLATSIHR